jgi:Second Messenger Oligonucleotide or Dinucleotide Synthetase domain
MLYRYSTDAAFTEANDPILEGICRKLQLSKTQYQQAVKHYESVGNWLEEAGLPLTLLRVYPQGSLPMGTTNKPLSHDEYDLDSVCELNIDWRVVQPDDLVNVVASGLSQHEDYKKRLTILPRCIRLTYAHQFHLDIVPACRNADVGEGQIRLSDGNGGWKDSNSKKFIDWFNDKADLYKSFGRATFDFAEPLPAQESLEEKAPLKCAVQLIKRSRDVYFRTQPDLSPASIVLSALCAQSYQGKSSVFDTVADCLGAIKTKILEVKPRRIIVINPVNEVYEDLGEKWNNSQNYSEFTKWIYFFQEQWHELRDTKGIHNITRMLENLFGEQPTQEAIADFCEKMQQSRSDGLLRVAPATGLLTTSQKNILIPKNTFYGQ